MVVDEPTSALDPSSAGSVLRVMKAFAQTGITMICVTYEVGFARRVPDRCVFMKRGETIHNAPAEQFFASLRERAPEASPRTGSVAHNIDKGLS